MSLRPNWRPETKKLLGIYVEDDSSPKPPTLAWVQEQCRRGSLRPLVEAFLQEQAEPLEPELLLVEKLDNDLVHCRIPCRLFDHEGAAAFATEVRFVLNPQTGLGRRLTD